MFNYHLKRSKEYYCTDISWSGTFERLHWIFFENYDPRARIVRGVAKEVFDIVGREPLIEVAEALEAAALSDPYFKKRKLYPNVDFYSGLIYKAMGFPTDFFPVLFAIPRTVGWLSHW